MNKLKTFVEESIKQAEQYMAMLEKDYYKKETEVKLLKELLEKIKYFHD